MDLHFLGFLGTVLAMGMAVALPIAFLIRVRAGTKPPALIGGTERADLETAVRDQAVQLDDALRRIGELEERLDFTERLLTQREPPALPREGASPGGAEPGVS